MSQNRPRNRLGGVFNPQAVITKRFAGGLGMILGDVSEEFARNAREITVGLPLYVRKFLRDKNIRIAFGKTLPFMAPDHCAQGESVPEEAHDNHTWEELKGIYFPEDEDRAILIPEMRMNPRKASWEKNSAEDSLYHEIGHVIDHLRSERNGYDSTRRVSVFHRAYHEDLESHGLDQETLDFYPYNRPEEIAAETWAQLHGRHLSLVDIPGMFPRCAKQVEYADHEIAERYGHKPKRGFRLAA